jgi:N-sulfoglucosamine sulfohydrolase
MRFLLVYSCFLLVVGLALGSLPLLAQKPNILFILSDDHSRVFMGDADGTKDLQTPNLNRLSREGIRFTRAYTTAPQCVPSRASLLTGRCPVDVEMTRFTAPLGREYRTIPEFLRQHGYYTGIGGRHFHLDGHTAKMPESAAVYNQYGLATFANRVDYLRDAVPELDSLSITRLTEFLDKLPVANHRNADRRNAAQPFFFWLNFSNPHRPFTALRNRPNPATLTLPPDFPDTPLLREDLADHYAEIQDLDYHVGQVLDELDRRKLLDNTVIVFMGDNGSAVLRGKGTLYERGLNVPLVLRLPGKRGQGTVCHELISGEDLAPTLLELAGLKPDSAMTGRSFASVASNPTQPLHPYVFAERGPHGAGFPGSTASFDLGRVVIGKRYKLIYNVLWQLPYDPVDFNSHPLWQDLVRQNHQNTLAEPFKTLLFQPQRSVFELFDLQTDPHERTNLAEQPDVKAVEYELKKALDKWMLLNRDYLPLPLRPSDSR